MFLYLRYNLLELTNKIDVMTSSKLVNELCILKNF